MRWLRAPSVCMFTIIRNAARATVARHQPLYGSDLILLVYLLLVRTGSQPCGAPRLPGTTHETNFTLGTGHLLSTLQG